MGKRTEQAVRYSWRIMRGRLFARDDCGAREVVYVVDHFARHVLLHGDIAVHQLGLAVAVAARLLPEGCPEPRVLLPCGYRPPEGLSWFNGFLVRKLPAG